MKTRILNPGFWWGLLLVPVFLWKAEAQPAAGQPPAPVTNLLQVIRLLNSNVRAVRDVRLEATVLEASDPALGVVILQDDTATELFQFTGHTTNLSPGDVIRINRRNRLLRRGERGVMFSSGPAVDNNGIHQLTTVAGGFGLKKGMHSLTIEWFKRTYQPGLELKWQLPGFPLSNIPGTNFFHFSNDAGSSDESPLPGLIAECYEGSWEYIPNFDLLIPKKVQTVTNFSLDVRTRDESVGIRFRGYFNVAEDGTYRFSSRSSDGSMVFVDDYSGPFTVVGKAAVPAPVPMSINESLTAPVKPSWVSVEGRVNSAVAVGRGLDLELRSEANSLQVWVADARGLTNLLHARIRVTGVGRSLFGSQGEPMLGEVSAVNARGIEVIQSSIREKTEPATLLKAKEVQGLSLADARRHLPIRLRGVVTARARPVDAWLALQDDSRGIFVTVRNRSGDFPAIGDFYELEGTSDAGDFAPVMNATRVVRLGKGELPLPLHPTWDELNNGSADVQWVEVKGLVTGLHGNTFSMLMPSGQMEVQIEGPDPSSLPSFERAFVRIRGVLFAQWNAAREVRVGNILLRNARITVETPPPVDPFEAVVKTPRELLLFDTQATSFRPVKVRGQLIYVDDTQAYLQEDGAGIRLLPAQKLNLKAGDMVEAVGYPDIRRTDMLLHEAMVRKIGAAKLLAPKELSESFDGVEGMDSTRVRLEGQLLGTHFEQYHTVLEMQSGRHLYRARLAGVLRDQPRTGSQLALDGVYVSKGGGSEQAGADAFELLLNSPAEISVLSQPPWWTLSRLLILVGILSAVLIVSALWITQLRRVVENRTTQLQREIQERLRAEQQSALEVERSRIARDLHDDLGASLTEIAVLAGHARGANTVGEGLVTMLRNIGSKARELVAALDIIVWAVDPKDNSLQSVADYLCDFTDEFLSPSGIACRFDVPVALPAIVFEGRARHDLFLTVKETLNNIVRHAHATQVEFRISMTDGRLLIVISDNGRGFDVATATGGKGLKSLPLRLTRIGGHHEIKSTVGKGTVVTIEVSLPVKEIKEKVG